LYRFIVVVVVVVVVFVVFIHSLLLLLFFVVVVFSYCAFFFLALIQFSRSAPKKDPLSSHSPVSPFANAGGGKRETTAPSRDTQQSHVQPRGGPKSAGGQRMGLACLLGIPFFLLV
jgi:hypothetical protein